MNLHAKNIVYQIVIITKHYITMKKINNIIKKNQVIWEIYKDEYFYYKNVFNICNTKTTHVLQNLML